MTNGSPEAFPFSAAKTPTENPRNQQLPKYRTSQKPVASNPQEW
jgi:hypothetical protein